LAVPRAEDFPALAAELRNICFNRPATITAEIRLALVNQLCDAMEHIIACANAYHAPAGFATEVFTFREMLLAHWRLPPGASGRPGIGELSRAFWNADGAVNHIQIYFDSQERRRKNDAQDGNEVAGQSGVLRCGEERPPVTPATPAKLLHNWREILSAVKLPNDPSSRRAVRAYIKKFGGPIKLPKQGGQPWVEETKLLAWWSRLEQMMEAFSREEEQRQMDVRECTKDQYNYGRNGTVVIEISGSVRRRREKNRNQ
jgi:hypothetical protein